MNEDVIKQIAQTAEQLLAELQRRDSLGSNAWAMVAAAMPAIVTETCRAHERRERDLAREDAG
jgi:hypothetical protein